MQTQLLSLWVRLAHPLKGAFGHSYQGLGLMFIKICIAWTLVWGSAFASPSCGELFLFLNKSSIGRLVEFVRIQETDASCSVASMLAVVNYYRGQQGLRPIPNESALSNKYRNKDWSIATQNGGTGVSLNELFKIAKDIFPKVGLNKRIEIRSAVEVNEFLKQWEQDLKWKSEDPHQRVLLLNLDQGILFNEVGEGHFVLVGKVDFKRRAVELLDTDSSIDFGKVYEVSIDQLSRAMIGEKDPFGFKRGYLRIY